MDNEFEITEDELIAALDGIIKMNTPDDWKPLIDSIHEEIVLTRGRPVTLFPPCWTVH